MKVEMRPDNFKKPIRADIDAMHRSLVLFFLERSDPWVGATAERIKTELLSVVAAVPDWFPPSQDVIGITELVPV